VFLLSHPKFHQKNLEFAIDLLLENGYPLNLIFDKMNKRIKTLIYNQNKKSLNSVDKNNAVENISGRKIIVLPYINRISE